MPIYGGYDPTRLAFRPDFLFSSEMGRTLEVASN